MKLFILGLIILLIVVCQIYKLIKEKDNIVNIKKNIEGAAGIGNAEVDNTDVAESENSDQVMSEEEYKKFIDNETNFIMTTSKYYDKLINGITLKNMKKSDKKTSDFVHLDSNNQLVYDSFGNMEGFENNRVNTSRNIDKCRAITKCEMLDQPGYEDCGYCGALGKPYDTPGKFDYKPKATGGKTIGPDVCPNDAFEAHPPKGKFFPNKLGNRWATTTYDCKKIQEQDKCSSVKNCNELSDASGNNSLGAICGWCPSDKAYPRDDEYQLKYDEDKEKNKITDIKGDRCSAFYETYINEDDELTPYFEKLQKADECSSCDNSGGMIRDDAGYPKWSSGCLQDIWAAPLRSDKQKMIVECTTNFDDPLKNVGIWEKNYGDDLSGCTRDDTANCINTQGRHFFNWGSNKWYKIQNDMRQNVTYPIYKFKKDYNTNSTLNTDRKIWTHGDLADDFIIDPTARHKWIMNDQDISFNNTRNKASKYSGTRHKMPYYNVKNIWKQCFNKENKDNELRCIPNDDMIREFKGNNQEMVDPENPYLTTKMKKSEYYDRWESKCKELTDSGVCDKDDYWPKGSKNKLPSNYGFQQNCTLD